jgi:chromosome segregation ATPase
VQHELVEMQNQLTALQSALSELAADKDRLLMRLSAEAKEAHQLASERAAELHRVQSQHELDAVRWAQERAGLQSEVLQIRSSLASVQESANTAQAQLVEERSNLKAELDAMMDKLTACESSQRVLASVAVENERLQSELALSEDERSRVDAALSSMRTEHARLAAQHDALVQEHKELRGVYSAHLQDGQRVEAVYSHALSEARSELAGMSVALDACRGRLSAHGAAAAENERYDRLLEQCTELRAEVDVLVNLLAHSENHACAPIGGDDQVQILIREAEERMRCALSERDEVIELLQAKTVCVMVMVCVIGCVCDGVCV